jgi:hypothetical protein
MSNGAVAIAVPSGWSAPSTTGTAAGFFTASAGTRSVSSGQMVVSGVTLAAGAKLTVVYGAKAQGGPGATSPSTGSTQTWTTRQRSSSAGSSTVLAAGSPSVTVFAPDGSGSMTPSQSTVAHAVTGKTLTFTYSVAAGGMSNGTLTLVVPSGWSVPSTTGSAPGYVTAGTGTVVVSNRTITVSGITRAGGTTVSITYGSKAAGGPGATAPPTAVGAQTWQARQRSTGAGTLTNLATSPSITVT